THLCVPQSLLAEQRTCRSSCVGVPGFLPDQVMHPPVQPRCRGQPPAAVEEPTRTVDINVPLPSSQTPTRDPEEDLLCIAKTFCYLRESGWYWGSINATDAKQQLQKMPEGFFLVRDSTHHSYLFTLSVQTNRGPTNIRIEYSNGLFRLDSNYLCKPYIMSFPDVVSLVQYYVSNCHSEGNKQKSRESSPTPLVPPSPKETKGVHFKLLHPLPRGGQSPSLQHLCRLQINRCLSPSSDTMELPLPKRMVEYLERYPFKL
uniref:Cytokine-inducible SH2-containing protein n=1 Tax=Leptobrachium leishanense TaxID=445787 RepID=A0A8C5WC60_9ANUR